MALLSLALGFISVISISSHQTSFAPRFPFYFPPPGHFSPPYYHFRHNEASNLQSQFTNLAIKFGEMERALASHQHSKPFLNVRIVEHFPDDMALEELGFSKRPEEILSDPTFQRLEQQLQGKFLPPFKLGFVIVLKKMAIKILALEALIKKFGNSCQEYCTSVGGEIVDGHCFTLSSNSVTFDEAQAQCQASGGYLAIPDASWLTPEFQAEFIEKFGTSPGTFWVGASVDADGNITGPDGSTIPININPPPPEGDIVVTIVNGQISFNVVPPGSTSTYPYVCEHPCIA